MTFRKVVLEPLKREAGMPDGSDIEVVHWVGINEQLKNITGQLKEVMASLSLLQRQDDLSSAERKNHDYRLTQLESWRDQMPQNARSNWNLSFNGCSTIAFVVSAVAGIIGGFAGVAAVIVALVLRG